MRSVTIQQATTHIAALLDDVKGGERVVIVEDGEPVAELFPAGQRPRPAADVFRDIDRLRAGNRLDGLSILELRDEGRH